MPGEKIFTESFRGYNKKEVNDYIEEQNRTAAIAKEGLEFQISELERQKNELSRKYAEVSAENKKYVDISRDLENAALDIENQRKTIIALKEENEILKTQIVLKQEKIDKLTQELQNYSQANEKPNYAVHTNMTSESAVSGNTISGNNVSENNVFKNPVLTADAAEEKANEILRLAVEKAQKQAEEIKAQSEAQVALNLKKVKLLYKRRDELKKIFEAVKAKTDELYGSVSEILDKKE